MIDVTGESYEKNRSEKHPYQKDLGRDFGTVMPSAPHPQDQQGYNHRGEQNGEANPFVPDHRLGADGLSPGKSPKAAT